MKYIGWVILMFSALLASAQKDFNRGFLVTSYGADIMVPKFMPLSEDSLLFLAGDRFGIADINQLIAHKTLRIINESQLDREVEIESITSIDTDLVFVVFTSFKSEFIGIDIAHCIAIIDMSSKSIIASYRFPDAKSKEVITNPILMESGNLLIARRAKNGGEQSELGLIELDRELNVVKKKRVVFSNDGFRFSIPNIIVSDAEIHIITRIVNTNESKYDGVGHLELNQNLDIVNSEHWTFPDHELSIKNNIKVASDGRLIVATKANARGQLYSGGGWLIYDGMKLEGALISKYDASIQEQRVEMTDIFSEGNEITLIGGFLTDNGMFTNLATYKSSLNNLNRKVEVLFSGSGDMKDLYGQIVPLSNNKLLYVGEGHTLQDYFDRPKEGFVAVKEEANSRNMCEAMEYEINLTPVVGTINSISVELIEETNALGLAPVELSLESLAIEEKRAILEPIDSDFIPLDDVEGYYKFQPIASNYIFGRDSILWSFGDGNTSNSSVPLHSYASNVNFPVEVCLAMENICATTITCKKIENFNNTRTFNAAGASISPNPGRIKFSLQCPEKWVGATISCYDQQGQKVKEKQVDSTTISVPMNNISEGVYIIRIEHALLGTISTSWVKQ